MKNNHIDQAAIIMALENYYLHGIYTGNLDLLRQIFHPGTFLFGDVNGRPYFKTLEQYFDAVKNRQSPKDSGKPFNGEIISVRVKNSIAVAEVKVKMYDFNYHDILSLHQIEGRWFIVNKLLTDVRE